MEYLSLLPNLLIAVIGWFLRETMMEIKSLKKSVADSEKKLALIELDYVNKHNNMTERFTELSMGMKELTKEIQLLNKEIQKKL